MSRSGVLHYLLIPCVIFLHLYLAPYTKVEESFNIQAIHDILEYGLPTSNVFYKFKALYDHMTFSGSVPRTFVGALVVAGLARPLTWLNSLLHHEYISQCLTEQTIVRFSLALFIAPALFLYTRAVKKAYGIHTARWYSILQASQFHVIYYASRTLPNTFAFCLSTLSLAAALPDPTSSVSTVKRARLSLYLLTLATVIFRSELALLLASQACYLVFKSHGLDNRVAIIRNTILPAVVIATLVGLCITIGVDTYFWQSSTLLWPEAAAFLFNVLPSDDHQGASAWGTSPWHWYFTSALPRLIFSPALVLLPYGIFFTAQQGAVLDNLVPAIGYTALYSFLPHKETRFLFPVVPSITLAIAISASYLGTRRRRLSRYVMRFILASTVIVAIVSHGILLPLSAQSYPGGHSLQALHYYHSHLYKQSENGLARQSTIKVHLTNLALQTGITRFLEQPYTYADLTSQLHISKGANPTGQPLVLPGSPDKGKPDLTYYPKPTGIVTSKRDLHAGIEPMWIYDKSSLESDFLSPAFWSQFDYVIVEEPARVIGAWKIISEVKALRRERPRIIKPRENRGLIRHEHGDAASRSRVDGLYELLHAMYPQPIPWLYSMLHDVLREGYGVGRSLTGGYWFDWGVETRLYILQQDESGISPDPPTHQTGATM